MKIVRLYDKPYKEEYLSSLSAAQSIRCDKRFFNYMFDYETELDKDIKDFNIHEIIKAFIGVPVVTSQQYKLSKISLKRYREYHGLRELKLPSNVAIKQEYIDHGVPLYVLDDKDLYNTIVRIAKHSDHDFEFYEMYAALLFLSYYGLSEQECMTIQKTFIEDFRLPNGMVVTNPDIQQFFVKLSQSRGFKIGDNRQMEYMNTPYMLRLAYYEGRLPKSKGMKIDSAGLAIIKSKAKCMTKLSKKLTLPNVTAAGQMNRAFEKDLQYHDFKVILPYPEIKRAFRNGTLSHGMAILDEEEYQLFKAFRLKNNL